MRAAEPVRTRSGGRRALTWTWLRVRTSTRHEPTPVTSKVMDSITSRRYGCPMTAYAIANLTNVDLNADIVRYLQEIDDTLTPFGGRFLVHGVTPEVVEGPWADATVIIGFPDIDAARAWYASP